MAANVAMGKAPAGSVGAVDAGGATVDSTGEVDAGGATVEPTEAVVSVPLGDAVHPASATTRARAETRP
jgi:hypothetical protein